MKTIKVAVISWTVNVIEREAVDILIEERDDGRFTVRSFVEYKKGDLFKRTYKSLDGANRSFNEQVGFIVSTQWNSIDFRIEKIE